MKPPARHPSPAPNPKSRLPANGLRLSAMDGYALVFGLFLGLALLKLGNPVILDSKVSAPRNAAELWSYAWPPGWSIWFLAPLAAVGFVAGVSKQAGAGRLSRWLWGLPLAWFGWQLVSASQTVDASLTKITLLHFVGLLCCYFIGARLFTTRRLLGLALVGILAGFVICCIKAVDQKWVEFPAERTFLVESEKSGWTNLPPELVLEMKEQRVIVQTNGVDIANPVILQKYERGRVFGTLVYPNALAGAVLLIFPVAITIALLKTRSFRPVTRGAAVAVTAFLGLGSLFWTGSKSGWLIALAMVGVWLFGRVRSARLKWISLGLIAVIGLALFAIRFQDYFARGATSVGARFDYWRAALAVVRDEPVFGSGPGTFQRPYEQIKTPEAEMARLTHNDYLQQFSDSGVVGGIAYAGWVGLILITLWRRLRSNPDALHAALFLGLQGWFLQGLSEFSLYIPALAWTAFFLAGALVSRESHRQNPR